MQDERPSLPPATTPLPGWLQPLVQVTTQVGVPTVFAGILLWFVLSRVMGTLELMQKMEEDRSRVVIAMQSTLIEALDRQADRFVEAINENIKVNKELAAERARQ